MYKVTISIDKTSGYPPLINSETIYTIYQGIYSYRNLIDFLEINVQERDAYTQAIRDIADLQEGLLEFKISFTEGTILNMPELSEEYTIEYTIERA